MNTNMPADSPLLEFIDVSKAFPSPTPGREVSVLDGLNLALAAGEALAVVGPSGSGKSTLLNLAAALDKPTGGRVLLEGCDFASMNDRGLSRLRNRRIGMVFQAHHLLPQCTVWENVLIPATSGGRASRDAQERAAALLERVGLADRLSHRPGQLSGGQCQRVAVVRALVNAPVLLLADEPTGSLDRAAAESLGELLVELNREQGVATLIVTHSAALADRIGAVRELRDGRLAAETSR